MTAFYGSVRMIVAEKENRPFRRAKRPVKRATARFCASKFVKKLKFPVFLAILSALTGRQKIIIVPLSQGGGEYAVTLRPFGPDSQSTKRPLYDSAKYMKQIY